MGQWPALGYLPYTNFYFSFCLQELNLILIKPQRYKSLRTKVTNKPDRYVTPYLKSLNNNFNANSFAQLKLKKKTSLSIKFWVLYNSRWSSKSLINYFTFDVWRGLTAVLARTQCVLPSRHIDLQATTSSYSQNSGQYVCFANRSRLGNKTNKSVHKLFHC